MAYVLSLDQGTTSSRAILFNHNGTVAAEAHREFEQHYPKPGWVEHDPFDLLTSQLSAAVEVLGRAGVRPRDLDSLGIANQRETTLVWDRETGKPVYNAIVWQDRRTAAACEQLRDSGAEATFRDRTGLRLDPYFSGTKVAWILDNVPGARIRAEAGRLAFGTVDSWLIWNLTSGKRHVTDVTNASRTLLYNIVEGKWDPELLRLLRIPESMLPQAVWSSGRLGPVTTTLGLGSVEIAGVAGDQQAAMFGQLCLRPGDAKNTYGTGCFLLQHIGNKFVPSKHQLLTTLACSTARKLEYALEGSVFIGGAVVQWLRDNLHLIRTSSDVEALAASVPDSGNVAFVPAFVGLGAPHWDAYARGALLGLERGTGPGHIARAALESIAFQVADVVTAMGADAGTPFQELRVDGGAAVNNLLLQIQADLLEIPVIRPPVTETTALGAAYLAGLATGFWGTAEELQEQRQEVVRFEPKRNPADVATARARWKSAVERSKHWIEKDSFA